MAQRIDLQKLLGIDGGLSYIIHRYPDAEESQHKKNRKFKLREEKTASAALKRLPDGTWIVTDFGDDSKGRSAVQVAMREDGSDFVTALKVVARFYNFEGEASPEVRADFNAYLQAHQENADISSLSPMRQYLRPAVIVQAP